jgi:hypothetical protein
MKLLFAALLLAVSTAWAAPQDPGAECRFHLECTNQNDHFSLDFRSKTNDCSDDNTQAVFKKGDQSVTLDLPQNWYFFTDHITKTQPAVCADKSDRPFAAYRVGKHRALLFVKSSGRPSYDNVTVVLLDTAQGKVLDHKDIGSTRNNFVAVLKSGRGFKVRIIRDSLSFHKLVTCDCDAPFVDDWMQVGVKGDKIFSYWRKK